MITRNNYRGYYSGDAKTLEQAILSDAPIVEQLIAAEKCLTVALYRHEGMLFLYLEALEETLTPKVLFPHLSALLSLWPGKASADPAELLTPRPWVSMYPVYYHDKPESKEQWARKGEKKRRGRIAILKEDKLFSYVYYHKALVDEGLLDGDRYQFIALHENILFSYFEEPKCFTHIKKECMEESSVIKEWLAANPESHFDHELSGEENFLMIQEIYSAGV
ncbi:MAG: hypothetical protein J6K04_09200 [Lachnospiraceae bacterium]|nr:hypothetical protein [Lachnospiraceae bacterium]